MKKYLVYLAIIFSFLFSTTCVVPLSVQAVVPTTNSTSSATGDGVTNTFSFTFELLQASDLTVYVNSVLQTQNVAYTVQPTGGSYPCTGGTITFQTTFTPVALAAILMARQLTLTQTIALPVEGSLPSSTLQTVFDRASMQIQQINTNQLLSLQLPITSVGTVNTALPTPVALNVIGWDSGAMNVVNYTPQQIAASAVVSGVFGPTTSTTGHIATFNNATGNLLADSGTSVATINSNITAVGSIFGTSNPNSSVTGVQGQHYYDTSNIVEYICTANGNSNWLRLSVPAGTVISWWSTSAVPAGWVLCNGVLQSGVTPPNEIGIVEQGADKTGGSSTANAAGYGSQANQSTFGIVSNNLNHTHTLTLGGGSGVNEGTGTAIGLSSSLGTVSTQPAVLAIVKIMKL